jgi:hypothetical protein
VKTGGGSFLLGLLVENRKVCIERSGGWERLTGVTDETGERVKALEGAVLGFGVCESGSTSKPAPVGGAAVCAELLDECFRGKGSKLSKKRLQEQDLQN